MSPPIVILLPFTEIAISGLMARNSSFPVIRLKKDIVAPSGESEKLLEISPLDIVTEPFFSMISDLNGALFRSQSLLLLIVHEEVMTNNNKRAESFFIGTGL